MPSRELAVRALGVGDSIGLHGVVLPPLLCLILVRVEVLSRRYFVQASLFAECRFVEMGVVWLRGELRSLY